MSDRYHLITTQAEPGRFAAFGRHGGVPGTRLSLGLDAISGNRGGWEMNMCAGMTGGGA